VSQKGSPTLSIVTWRRITRF